MGTNWIKRMGIGGLWLVVSTVWAQPDASLEQADRLLNWRAYDRAIDAYTQLLTAPKNRLTASQRATAQERLAFAYAQVGNHAKAERFYRESLDSSPRKDPQRTLQYAKILATNGKFREAQQQYEQYWQLNKQAPIRPLTPLSASATPGASQGSVRYRLEHLALNSSAEEFSPAFYQDGLVYVSGTKGGSTIETAGSGGGRGYLDLYYAPQRDNLLAGQIINADGSVRALAIERTRGERSVGRDHYTAPTANDSPTLPSFNGRIKLTEGLNSGARPANSAQRFSPALNTRYHEGPATFSRDGSRIIFTRNNYNGGRARQSKENITKLKLYTARQQNGAWADVTELPFNSDEYSVGHPTLSYDERRLYFASDMPGGFGGTDLYVSRYQNGTWSKPVNLGASINTKGNEMFPFADEGGNLYFATDGRRGLGGLDVFMAILENGTEVRRIEHLDSPINSPQDDFGLITDGSRQGGYFSSNRRSGNDDIYRFVREKARFGCRNLVLRLYDTETNEPLDSVRIEIASQAEGQTDRVVTTDRNGYAQLCLQADREFMFQASRAGFVRSTVGFSTRHLIDDQPSRLELGLSKPAVIVNTVVTGPAVGDSQPLTRSRIGGVVTSERDNQPLEGVTVRLRNECNRMVATYVTGSDGRYEFNLTPGCDYTLTASKPTFGTNVNKIKQLSAKSRPGELSADLRMLSVGDVVAIDNIYYDLDQFSLRPDAARELDKLVATMRKYPTLRIEIRSHTDSRGDAVHNRALSTQRAKAVAGYLTTRGISRRRMTTLGLGESQLVNNCTDGVICTEAEHQRNRRTEFKVVEIK